MLADPPIPAREAPADFPHGLPEVPPTVEEINQLFELWGNVKRINSLEMTEWDGRERSTYMLWTTEDRRQFRVIWDEDDEAFWTSERTAPL